MSEETPNQNTTEVDPLTLAAGGWEPPRYPVLMPERICRFKVKSSTIGDVKNTDRKQLILTVTTEKDYPDTDGKTIHAGYRLTKYIGVSPIPETDNRRARTMKEIGTDLAMALKACGKADKSPRDLLDNPSMLEGEIVDFRVGLGKPTAEFPNPSNTLTFSLPT